MPCSTIRLDGHTDKNLRTYAARFKLKTGAKRHKLGSATSELDAMPIMRLYSVKLPGQAGPSWAKLGQGGSLTIRHFLGTDPFLCVQFLCLTVFLKFVFILWFSFYDSVIHSFRILLFLIIPFLQFFFFVFLCCSSLLPFTSSDPN